MFYNTIDLSGDLLKKELLNSLKQEGFITAIFKSNPKSLIIPSQVLRAYNKCYQKDVPITSIRRAITDLTNKGVLRKTSVMATGEYGKKEHYWVLRESKSVQIEWVF